jgi:hypothetical protein
MIALLQYCTRSLSAPYPGILDLVADAKIEELSVTRFSWVVMVEFSRAISHVSMPGTGIVPLFKLHSEVEALGY